MEAKAVKERPFPLVAEMVRKTILRLKKRSRRPVKPQPPSYIDHLHGGELRKRAPYRLEHPETGADCGFGFEDDNGRMYRCRHGRPGDRLWVRETAQIIETSDGMSYAGNVTDDPQNHRMVRVKYAADGAESDWLPYPSRLEYLEVGQCVANGCYREAARIHLEITDVRVEQVQSITEAEAALEGAPRAIERKVHGWTPHVLGFSELWDGLYMGELSWRANPWVWAISFEPVP